MALQPTYGCLQRLLDDGHERSLKDGFNPLAEVISTKRLQDKTKVMLTDGQHVVSGVAQPGSLPQGINVPVGGLLRLVRYSWQTLGGKNFLVLDQADYLGTVAERTRPETLRRLEGCSDGMTQMSQAAPASTWAQPLPQAASGQGGFPGPSFQTPEKRFGGAQVDQTPPPVPGQQQQQQQQQQMLPPQQAGAFGGSFSGSRAPQPAGHFTDGLFEHDPPSANPGAPQRQQAPPVAASGPWNQASMASSSNPYSSGPAPAAAATAPAPAFGGLQAPTLQSFFGPAGGASPGAAAFSAAGPDAVPARAAGRRTSVGGTAPVCPISELSQYNRSWAIRARVVCKSEIMKYSNAKGEGQRFKADFKDASGEISGTFFNKAVEPFYDMLQQGKVYRISRANVKPANPRFDKGAFTIMFDERSSIEEEPEDIGIPGLSFDFKPLSGVELLAANEVCDVKAVIYAVHEPFTFTSRNSGKEMTKRELGLWDSSGADGSTTVELTLWQERALKTFSVGTVVFLKDARVGEWQGNKTLSSPPVMETSPDHPEAATLLAQYEEMQRTRPLSAQSKSYGGGGHVKSLAEIKEEDMNLVIRDPGQPLDKDGPRSVHRHTCSVVVTSVPTDRLPCYPSCNKMVAKEPPMFGGATQAVNNDQQRACQKKCTQEGDVWRCGAGHEVAHPVYRYLCRFQTIDHTDTLEVNTFDEVGKKLYGVDANEFAAAFENEGPEELNKRVLWQRYTFKMRSSKEIWQEAERVRCNVDEATPIDYQKDARRLLGEVTAALNP